MRQLVISALLLLTACGTDIYTSVSGYSAKAPPSGTTYFMVPAKEGVTADDFEFQEYAAHVQRALRDKGWKRVPVGSNAAMGLVIDYGIGEPRREVSTGVLPLWGQTGVASSTTTGTINSFGNTATVNGTTTHTPSYGVTGYMPISRTDTVYDRYLGVYAYDMPKGDGAKPVEIWRTGVTSSGTTADLRQVVPFLVMSAAPHFGTNTGRAIPVTLSMSEKALAGFLAKPVD